MLSAKLSQTLRVLPALAAQDITTQRQGAFLSLGGCQRFLATATGGAIGNGKTVTISLLQAQDSAGTGAKPLGSSVVAASGADGTVLAPVIEGGVSDLDVANNYAFVAVVLVSNNGAAVQAGAVMILGGNRYNPA